MNLDIERVLELYKGRIAELEHELILLAVRCEMLDKEINKDKDSK